MAFAGRWLPDDERDWLVNELQTELQAKREFEITRYASVSVPSRFYC